MQQQRCQNCGAPLEAGFAGCPSCGSPVADGRSDGAATGWAPTAATRSLSRPARRRLAYLVIKTGSEEGKSFELKEETPVGSERNSSGLRIADQYVSLRHGLVKLEDGVYVYHDLASRNGSYLVGKNGDKQRIKSPLRLMHGDTIELGKTRIAYVEAGK